MMDELWGSGWRHQGHLFFRYNHCFMGGKLHDILPIRIKLTDFCPSKSQRRIIQKNADLRWQIGPAFFDEETHDIFARHSARFSDNIPESIYSFFTATPADTPCECHCIRALLNGKLIAVSFMDVGLKASSSVYAIFDPDYADRSLGTLTLLRELDHARCIGLDWLYPGYGTREPSHYDYKWRFSPMQMLDWESGEWNPTDLTRLRQGVV
jgi:leucyl-tRNA---protein transferase